MNLAAKTKAIVTAAAATTTTVFTCKYSYLLTYLLTYLLVNTVRLYLGI